MERKRLEEFEESLKGLTMERKRLEEFEESLR